MDSTLSSDDWSEIDEPGPYNEELGRCKCCRIWHFKEDWTQYCSTFGNDGYLLEAHRYSKHPRNTVTRSLWETWPGDGRVLETSQSGKSDNWERWPNTSSVCRSATYPAATRQAGNDWSTTMFLINQPLTKFLEVDQAAENARIRIQTELWLFIDPTKPSTVGSVMFY